MPRRSGPKYLPKSRSVPCPDGYRSKRVHARFDADAENPARAKRQMYYGRAYFGKPVGASRQRSKITRDDVRPQRRQPGNGRKRRIVSTKRADVADAKYDARMEEDAEFAEKWELHNRCRITERDEKGQFTKDGGDYIGKEEENDEGWWRITSCDDNGWIWSKIDGEGGYVLDSDEEDLAGGAKKKKNPKKKKKKKKSTKKSTKSTKKSGKKKRSAPRAAPGPAYPKYSLKPVKPMDADKYGRQVMCVREDVVKAACEAKGKAIRIYGQKSKRAGQEYCGYRKKSKRSKRKSKPKPKRNK